MCAICVPGVCGGQKKALIHAVQLVTAGCKPLWACLGTAPKSFTRAKHALYH